MPRAALDDIYRPSLSLLTDLYQLTMACGYFRAGRIGDRATFHLFFRSPPFDGGYTIAAGLEQAMDFLERFHFPREELDYLATLTGSDGRSLFDEAFLRHLENLRFEGEVHAVPEGTALFPHEPILRVTGPLLQAQLLETPLLNLINFPTLIATKAARIAEAAGGDPVLEFGLRRAQGTDGALTAARAAYLGGAAATSNVLAGRLHGIPVKGTHAHSWVMSFDDELEAFRAYAHAQPNNTILLVDTYDTLAGVDHAITVGRELQARGGRLDGVRLDSGDLAYLSQQARAKLDAAGLTDAKVLASGDLDEHLIADLKRQGAEIDLWGVGTRLVTALDDPALGGVYKLAALLPADADPDDPTAWSPRLKLSEQTVKTSTPGRLQTRRFTHDGYFAADMIYNELDPPPANASDHRAIISPTDPTRRKRLPADAEAEDLLQPVFHDGRRLDDPPSLELIRQRVQDQLASLHPAIRRLKNPHEYPAGLAPSLHALKTRLIQQARGQAD